MLTETEALGKALAMALRNGPTGFGAEQAKIALGVITALSKANQITDDDADRCRVRLGNHSANRQWAIAHGFITAPPDALSNAVETEIEKLNLKEREEMAELTKKK